MIVAGFEFASQLVSNRHEWPYPLAATRLLWGHLPEPYHQRYNKARPNQTGPHWRSRAAGDPLSVTGPFGDR